MQWLLSNILTPSRALALFPCPASVLSTHCIWVPAFCRSGSSRWAQSAELLAAAREAHGQTDQSYCSVAENLVSWHLSFFDVVLKLPGASVSVKIGEIWLLRRCIKRTQARDLLHGSSGRLMASGKCGLMQFRLSLQMMFMGRLTQHSM